MSWVCFLGYKRVLLIVSVLVVSIYKYVDMYCGWL